MDEKTHSLELLSCAQLELEEIARLHLALSGPQSARRTVERLYAAMEQLRHAPLSGPALRDEALRAQGYRYILAGKYLVFYRCLERSVVVYHIAHGATDYPKLFREE